MLKLEKLELHGFKSFHDRTELAFDHGVTAVVGPNGCGKSNILDAMSWVLGEQSVKSLRGSQSEDLIFNGTEKKRPLGMAEVTLRLKATNGDLRSGQDQVAVTRRLHRSGESEYLINGVASRLKDIQDLLYGSGLGIRAYSFIEQGRIGWILSAKPLDRRALIEEAAGITKFRVKKREAELKLEAAELNLVRVRDIVAEVERQLASLKRQAAKARRWERTDAELKATLRELFVREREALGQREAASIERFRAEAERRQALVAEVGRSESELEHLRLGIEKQEAGLRSTGTRLHETEIEVDRNRTLIVTGRERLEELEARARELGEAMAGAQARHAETSAESGRKAAEMVRAAEREREAGAQVERRRGARRDAEAEVAAAEHRIEVRRGELIQAVHELAEAGNAVSGRSRLLEQTAGRQARIRAERARLEGEVAAALTQVVSTSEELARVQHQLRAREQEVREGFERAALLARERDHTRETEAEAVQSLERKEERERTLGRITEAAEDAGEATAAGRLMLGDRALGLVADFVRAGAERERAVEAALEPVLGALVVSEGGAAEEILGWATAEKRGVVRVLVAGARGQDSAATPDDTDVASLPAGLAAEPGVLGPLSRFLTLREEVRDALSARVAGFVVVESLADALRLKPRHPGLAFVTSAGEVVAADGLLRSAGKAEAGLLGLRRERRELVEEVAGLRAAIQASARRLAHLESGAAQAEDSARHAVTRLHEAEKELLGARHLQLAAEEAHRKCGELAGAVAAEAEELERECSEVERALEAERERLTASEGNRGQIERTLESERGALEIRRNAALERARELAEAEAELARSEEVLKALRAELQRLEQVAVERAEAIAALEIEIRATGERSDLLESEVGAAEEALSGLLAEVAALRDRVRTEEDQARTLRHELGAGESGLKALRIEAEQQRERVQVVEIERTRIEGERARLAERCREDLGTSLEELVAGAHLLLPGVTSALDAELDAESEGSLAEASGADGVAAGPGAAAAVGADASGERVGGVESDDDVDPASAGESDAELGTMLETASLEALRSRADVLKQKLNRLGPVNTLAIAEYQELKERHDFQSSQAKDLTDSIESLIQTIARINRTSRERFIECYEVVNRNFQEIFAHLFGGGRAELRLTDEENLLETGVDIVAQPPGKRLQNILLLSGGEKALTAIALLFALFRFKPSPFCILDEVDAPLDEKNIDRFLTLLRTLSDGTQFILITHSPRTMKVADTLYGVTMEEPGVSRLVSVKLKDAAA